MDRSIAKPTETLEDMVSLLRTQQQYMAKLRSLAGEFAALDFQPIVIIDGRVQPREITLPSNLTEAMQHTAVEIHRLETRIGSRL